MRSQRKYATAAAKNAHSSEGKVVQTRKILSALNTPAEIVLLLGGITSRIIYTSFHPHTAVCAERNVWLHFFWFICSTGRILYKNFTFYLDDTHTQQNKNIKVWLLNRIYLFNSETSIAAETIGNLWEPMRDKLFGALTDYVET